MRTLTTACSKRPNAATDCASRKVGDCDHGDGGGLTGLRTERNERYY